MGLDLWFKEDVGRILASTNETMTAAMGAIAPLDVDQAEAYRAGFTDALRAVAMAFGVAAPSGNNNDGRPSVQVLNPRRWYGGEVITYDDRR